jgi:hypothetical protein
MKYFGQISKMLGVTIPDESVSVVSQLFRGEAHDLLPRWEFDYLPLEEITGVANVAWSLGCGPASA